MAPFLAPKLGRFTSKILSYYRAPLGALALHGLVLYSNTPPPWPSHSDWPRLLLSQTFTCTSTLVISSQLLFLFTRPIKIEQSVPKRRHTKFRRRGITQKKENNIHNKAKVWNREPQSVFVCVCVRVIEYDQVQKWPSIPTISRQKRSDLERKKETNKHVL
jgi:hypothetical protein